MGDESVAAPAGRVARWRSRACRRRIVGIPTGVGFHNAIVSRWPLGDGRRACPAEADGHAGAPADPARPTWPRRGAHGRSPRPTSTTSSTSRRRASAQVAAVLDAVVDRRGDPERDLPVVDRRRLQRRARQRRDPHGHGPVGAAPRRACCSATAGSTSATARGYTWRRDNPYQADTAWPQRRLDYVFVSGPARSRSATRWRRGWPASTPSTASSPAITPPSSSSCARPDASRRRVRRRSVASHAVMATLRFNFGTMGSGKSTMALQIHHNLASRQLYGLLLTKLDREGAQVTSRLGVAAEAVEVVPRARSLQAGRRPLADPLHGVRRGAVLHRAAVRSARPGGRRSRCRRVRVRTDHRLSRRAVRRHQADAGDRRRASADAGRGAVLVRCPGDAQRPRGQRGGRLRRRHRRGR